MVTKTNTIVAWAIRQLTHSPVNHAGVYIGKGFIVEAQPGGARITRAREYPDAIWSHSKMTVHARLTVIHCALELVGTPYNFLDIAAQGIVRVFHWHAPHWALDRLGRSSRLQCAQLVDEAYRRAGIELFTDGRPEGLVAPSDLYDLMEK